MRVATTGLPRILVDGTGSEASSGLFAAALAIACLVHLVVILGVGFAFPPSDPGKQATRQLEVIVLQQAAPSDQKPEVADAFAQVDREGGGTEESREIEPGVETSVEPTSEIPAQVISLPPLPLLEPELVVPQQLRQPEVLAQPEPDPEPMSMPESWPQEPLEEPSPEPESPRVTAAEILDSRNLEIAELTARIQHNSAAYAKRPRRKAINASTREYKYASYLEAWRRKVERIGNLNYPEEAKRHKMYGNLILQVAVRADGSIEHIRIRRSSGFDLLDKAAIKIVELSAPFAPFPPDIRAETDVLDITRTWQFLSSNRLGWEN